MYSIEINYSTGDSFGSNLCTDELEINWNNPDNAYKALELITDHYKLYEEVENDSSYASHKKKKELYKKAKKSEWCQNALKKCPKLDTGPDDMVFCSIGLETDDGEIVIISPYWIGYFETLHSARVVSSTRSF